MTPVLDKITSLSFFESLKVSLLGMAIVFFVLVILFVMIRLLRTLVDKLELSKSIVSETVAVQDMHIALEGPQTPVTTGMIPPVGSMGDVKLHDVDDKTAAMLMAIVSDTTDVPLNELRFHSIHEKQSTINEGQSSLSAGMIEPKKKYTFQTGRELSDAMKYNITLNNKVYEIAVERGEAILMNVSDHASTPAAATVPVSAAAPAAIPPTGGTPAGDALKAPLPGTILSILVNIGDTVKAGQVLLIIEAMKMENEIVAQHDGKVVQILVSKGTAVTTGAPMIILA